MDGENSVMDDLGVLKSPKSTNINQPTVKLPPLLGGSSAWLRCLHHCWPSRPLGNFASEASVVLTTKNPKFFEMSRWWYSWFLCFFVAKCKWIHGYSLSICMYVHVLKCLTISRPFVSHSARQLSLPNVFAKSSSLWRNDAIGTKIRTLNVISEQFKNKEMQKSFKNGFRNISWLMFSGSTWINLLNLMSSSAPNKEDSICVPLGAMAFQVIGSLFFFANFGEKKSNWSPSTWKKRNSTSADVNGTWAMPLLGGVNVDCYNSCSCCDGCP